MSIPSLEAPPVRAGARRIPVALYWWVCAGFALGLASVTTLESHRIWGLCAAVGYGWAALAARRTGRPWGWAGAGPALIGAVLVPLAVLLVAGIAQSEVRVVEQSGRLLLSGGSPYLAHPVEVGDYNPYLPGMALFGLPHALLGDVPLADARLWFAVVFLASLGLAVRAGSGAGPGSRSGSGSVGWGLGAGGRLRTRWGIAGDGTAIVPLLAAFPAVALPLAVGGVDLPVIGLMCLALTWAGRRGSGVGAGVAMGLAAALKWTAWPLLPVGLVLVAAVSGRRAAIRAGWVSLVVAGAVVVPSALVDPRAFVEQVVMFPLGAGHAGSPADSPLPGYLLATYVPGGRVIAVVALAVSAVAVGVSLVVRRPVTVVAAADRLALGLGLAMCLMPATRFGYLVYPMVLLVWFRRGTWARWAARLVPFSGAAGVRRVVDRPVGAPVFGKR
ncbi:glycosyltransferase 87 family protein [Streptomyces sp. NPDC004539]|uniref:glycosyltransferase 87 family protein n=1 Tax=Streptomyces sp. NPDC004539 TaxID=3154280 RepID=UPI0033B72D84